jgi:lysophospholipase L1-like esterase
MPIPAGSRYVAMGSSPETSLVTITAGGNDVGFLPRLTLASLPWQRFEQLERNLTVIAARLAATTQAAASTAGWTYVASSAASADHHAWSAEPWTRRFQLRPGTSTDPEVH